MNHVWSYVFVYDRTREGRAFRMRTILDEYSRECPAIDVGRKFTHDVVMHRLTDLFFRRGIPEHIRSTIRPHSSLGYRPPAPEVIILMGAQVFGSVSLHCSPRASRLTLEVDQRIGAGQ